MNYRLFSLLSTILLFASCSNDSENESNTIVADKELNAITHINYIYGYVDQPATRTYTLNGNKIDFINKTVFHYFDEDSISETTQEAIYNEESNVYQTYFNESPSTEFEYSVVKIPTELPKINLPHLGYIPYNIILAQFDGMVQSYNTNYINTIIPLEPTNNYIITYKNILSMDNYPLSIKVFYNEKVRSETTYTYE